MKKNRRLLSKVLLIILTFTLYFPSNLNAENVKTNSYKYTWKENSMIDGSSQVEKGFYIPESMKHSDLTLSLNIKQSPTLIKDISSISILLNGAKVYSIYLEQIGTDGIIKLDIPKDLVNKGENSIVVEGFLKSTREKCEINDDVNWIVIERGSYFSFDYTSDDSTEIRNIFDNTYYSDGENSEVNIALPDKLTKDNYSQIASISALIGYKHKNKDSNMEIKTLKHSDLMTSDKEVLVIGTVSQIKDLDKSLLTESEWKTAEQSGYISIKKIGLKNHFIIIVSNDSQLETMCKILGNNSSRTQIVEKNYVLDKSKIINEKEFNENPTLSSLGYGELQRVGNGVKNFDYYFTIPANKTLTENSKFIFAYSNSSLVDYEKAYVTVQINGENILTKRITKEKNNDKLEFSIPEKYFDNIAFNISLKFNLKPGLETCIGQTYEDVWVSVDTINSNLKLNLKDREEYSLLNSQGFLQNKDGNIDGMMYVDDFKNISTYSLCKISAYFGDISQGVNKLLMKQETKIDGNSTGMIFGLNTSTIIKSLSNELKIPIKDSKHLENKDMFIQNTNSLSAIQILQKDKRLVITGSDTKEINKTIQNYKTVIGSKDTIILKDGESIDYIDEEVLTKHGDIDGINIGYNITIALSLLLITAIILFIIYHKKVK